MINSEKKYKVVAVSYLNTKPLLYGLLHHPIHQQLEVQLEIPSRCADLLKSGAADIGLVPIAVLPLLEEAYVFSHYCIGTDGEVATVCLVGDTPMEDWTSLLLDFHSRTSVQLTKVLLRDHWKLSPNLLPAQAGYIEDIKDTTGGLIIGDRAMNLQDKYKYVYDLGLAWKTHTGLPFVFAAWVSTKPLPTHVEEAFNEALALGIEHIPELMMLIPETSPGFDIEKYFRKNISYVLTEEKLQAMQLFFNKLGYDHFPAILPEPQRL